MISPSVSTRCASSRLSGGSGRPTIIRSAISRGGGISNRATFFHHNADALQIFRQWVLMKIISGVCAAFEEANEPLPTGLSAAGDDANDYIDILAAGMEAPFPPGAVSPASLTKQLEGWARESGRRRVVLLLDDAAHAFSPQQQREFFEVFRELRSSPVSAKAAVYPGITTYSPYMHVGHEAELIEAWYRPDADDFLPTMRALLERRLHLSFGNDWRDGANLSTIWRSRRLDCHVVFSSWFLSCWESKRITRQPQRKKCRRGRCGSRGVCTRHLQFSCRQDAALQALCRDRRGA